MEKTNILIIEDEAELREGISNILRMENYNVTEARHGKEGILLLEELNPNVVLCDINMPELNGYDFLEYFGKKQDYKNIPFIYITA